MGIGEFKRGLIRAEQWQNGRLTCPQKRLERAQSVSDCYEQGKSPCPVLIDKNRYPCIYIRLPSGLH